MAWILGHYWAMNELNSALACRSRSQDVSAAVVYLDSWWPRSTCTGQFSTFGFSIFHLVLCIFFKSTGRFLLFDCFCFYSCFLYILLLLGMKVSTLHARFLEACMAYIHLYGIYIHMYGLYGIHMSRKQARAPHFCMHIKHAKWEKTEEWHKQNGKWNPCKTGMSLVDLTGLLGGLGRVVNSLDFCLALLKSLGCVYFQRILSLQWKVGDSEFAFLEACSQNVFGNK